MTTREDQARTIRHNIQRLREGLGWNQAKLAKEARITAAALSKIEKGDGRIPTIVVLRKLAGALGVAVREITGEIGELSGDESQRKYREFHRRFAVFDDLPDADQQQLLDMAKRLKEVSKDE